MKSSDFGNSDFQNIGIIPESGDEVTCLWGIKMVKGLMNSYGIIGTFKATTMDILWLNLRLTKIYQFPPYVNTLYSPDGGGLRSGDSIVPSVVFNFIPYKRVQSIIIGDKIGFKVNLGAFSTFDVYFRIHGV